MQISVVIPTYNRAQLLGRAIHSVLAQTYAPLQIIIVNDGSNDATQALLEETFKDQVQVLYQDNRGVSAARNLGVAACSGDWIAFLDSDDEWLPGKLEAQVQALKGSGLRFCHTDEIWIRNGVRVNQMNKHEKNGGHIFEKCLPLCAISPSSVLIERELLKEAGRFDEALPACEDYDLWLRICCDHAVEYIATPQLVKYGGHSDQLSRQHWGMDRFRVQALHKLLQSNKLSSEQRTLTLKTMQRKIHILFKGALKHHNEPLQEQCEQIMACYNFHLTAESDNCSI